MTAKYEIVENGTGAFNIKVKKYWFLPSKLVIDPKAPRVIWSSKTKRGAQAYINILVKKSKK
jgi:hypothetical protein